MCEGYYAVLLIFKYWESHLSASLVNYYNNKIVFACVKERLREAVMCQPSRKEESPKQTSPKISHRLPHFH